ncbi:hypothetical protein ELQ18_07115 [Neisseria meningitidis]|nr:hypothetical protein [Neisseria meningitidis]
MKKSLFAAALLSLVLAACGGEKAAEAPAAEAPAAEAPATEAPAAEAPAAEDHGKKNDTRSLLFRTDIYRDYRYTC